MIIGILKEPAHENRVAALPEGAKALMAMGVDVAVETGAGQSAFAADAEYEAVGAKISLRSEIIGSADMIIGIHPPADKEIAQLNGKILVAMLNPLGDREMVDRLLSGNVTSFSLDNIPRTTRAQAMDVLSSMATVSGYKAVLTAASHLPKFFPMFMTAAGTVSPAKVLILGAGVAGLQAIATAKRLGGVVEAFDVRAAAKEEVLSLGAKFVEVEGAQDDAAAGGYAVEQTEDFKEKQRQLIHDHASKSDVIVSTAQIPGRTAPILITKETVEAMQPGSVIVDLAASTGGNCECTENNNTAEHHGVTIIGESNFPSTMPASASKMFGKNINNLMKILIKDGTANLDFEDDIIKGTCVTHQGNIISERVQSILQLQ